MKADVPPNKKPELTDLLSIKMGIGDVVQLQDFASDKHRHYVKLIGFFNKKSVLVSHPMQDEKLLFVKKGESYLLRGFSGTKTYEFTADVINVCLSPYPYLHLSFPSQVSTVNMRSAMRIKIRLVCAIKVKDVAQPVTGSIDDMSVSGTRVQSKMEFGKVGDEVEVSFRLPLDGTEQLLTIPAVVRNVTRETENSGADRAFLSGLEFMHKEGNERNSLHYFIYRNLAEQ